MGADPAGIMTLNGIPVLGGTVRRRDVNVVRMDGGGGDDTLVFDETDERVVAGPADELAPRHGGVGGSAGDSLIGGPGVDSIGGNGGDDTIDGGAGNDKDIGGPGNDTVDLGADSDQFTWNPGNRDDHVDGGGGTDTLIFNGSANDDSDRIFLEGSRVHVVTLQDHTGGPGPIDLSVSGFEQIHIINTPGPQPGVFVDDLAGTGVAVVHLFHTGPADDFVSGTLGADRIRISGSPATPITVAELTATVLVHGGSRLTVRGGDGDDIIDATGLAAGRITFGERGGDFPVADARGFDGNDTLIGTPGDDTLFGGNGINR